MTRTFDAPRQLVFDAYTKPELLKRWLGVFGGWSLAVCRVDLRVGGAYRYEWRRATGKTMGMNGVFREVVAPVRLVAEEIFDDPWHEGDAMSTIEFTEADGRTTVTHTVRYDSKAIRDGVLGSSFAEGVEASYVVLDGLLRSPRA